MSEQIANRSLNNPWRIAGHYFFLVLLAIICLVPIWVMISTSLKDQITIFDGKPIWFFFVPTIENYQDVVGAGKFDRYLLNSIIVATVSTFLTLLLGGLCAYALARAEFRGRRFAANATLLVRMVPPVVLAVPAFSMVLAFNIRSDLLVLIFFYTALNLPFAIWLLFGFYKQIPVELEEAAIVDGAHHYRYFSKSYSHS